MHQSKFTIFILFLLQSTFAFSQKKEKKQENPTATTAVAATPTATATKPAEPPKTGPKAYKDIITDKAKTQRGSLTTHKVEDKFYFEIPDSTIGREFMTVTRIVRSGTIPGTYGGEQINRQVIKFDKGPDNKIFLKAVQYINVSADSTAPIYKAVQNSNLLPIVQSFDIKAINKDTVARHNSSVIDVGDFFKSDNQVISLSSSTKTAYRITTLATDRSYIESMKSFPLNTEVKVVKTFNGTPPSPVAGPPSPIPTVTVPSIAAVGAVTMELNTSIIMLPKVPMKQRLFDLRVGYFANGYTVFDDNSQRTEDKTFAVRWRLEPKNAQDAEKQQRGELIEPAKPIVYYIDPATPKKWRTYLKQGIDDWQVAFEAAGWKNAIRGEILADNDTIINMEDARFSAIRYFASNIENAYGPNVHDPRSGEILESHIGWYHNVMKLLKKWYMTQAAAVDERARKNVFDDELMGQLIRFVSSHEVGHTLGLRHNYGSSHTVPVEKLRDPAFIKKNGHTPSIMDYARFNYVAQPGDGVTDLFPRIGDYDIWAIKWAYQTLDGSPEENQKVLNKQYIAEYAKNPRIWFGTETNPYDPRTQSECLGDNNMLASDYGIKNLKRIIVNLPEWTKEEAKDYDMLEESYNEIVNQYRRYIGHVVKNIGGIYETPKSVDQAEPVYEPTPKAIQKEAVNWLTKQVFDTPTWLLEPKVMSKFRPDFGVDALSRIQESAMVSLFNTDRLQRIIETNYANKNTYQLDELFVDVRNSVWSELKTRKAIDNHRRNLQKAHIDRLAALLVAPAGPYGGLSNVFGAVIPASIDPKKSDIVSLAKGHLQEMKGLIKSALAVPMADRLTKFHLQDCLDRIENALEPAKK